MTINAPAAWMLALYVANAREQGVTDTELRGTTQNDIVKEYLSRGTYIFPPAPSKRLIVDMVAWCAHNAPKWNPMNVCSYHLQEAGATPVQEIAYSLATAIDVLDAVRDSGQVAPEQFSQVFGAISFFVNAGIRFVEEICKLRAFTDLWDRIGLERYGVTDAKARRFRYGVQVNSLGLTEAQPENNAWRILIEALGVTLSRKARCRALQLPTWNEASVRSDGLKNTRPRIFPARARGSGCCSRCRASASRSRISSREKSARSRKRFIVPSAHRAACRRVLP